MEMHKEAVIRRLALISVTVFMIATALSVPLFVVWLFDLVSQKELLDRLCRIVWGTAFFAFCSGFFVLFVLHRLMIHMREYHFEPIAKDERIIVALTAYNDEACIGEAVREFKACPYVHQVVVVDNNSRDATTQRAIESGADRVVTEEVPGYGSCCMRALREASQLGEVIVLCEGDMTFVASDIPKFLSYLENAELVIGSRATQELRATETQMDWLINPANQVVAKLIQVRFWGVRLTDVGCTYRALRSKTFQALAPHLRVTGNHFSPHMFIEALKLNMRVVEIPVTFRKRWGESKGVGNNKLKAAKVACAMLKLLYRA